MGYWCSSATDRASGKPMKASVATPAAASATGLKVPAPLPASVASSTNVKTRVPHAYLTDEIAVNKILNYVAQSKGTSWLILLVH